MDGYSTAKRIVFLGNAIKYCRNMAMADLNLTAAQSEAISFILRDSVQEGLYSADLEKALQLSQSTVAGIIKRLEEKQYIKRIVDPKDSRKSMILPTEEGRAVQSRLKSYALSTESIITAGMSDEEVAEFRRLLDMALGNIEEFKRGKQYN